MLKSIYFISSHFHLYEVCIQGERGEYGSSLAKARFMLAPIAQLCLHPAAANHRKSGRRSRPGGEPAAAASTAVGERSRAAGGTKAREHHDQAPARRDRPRRGQGPPG